jgi:hypothetical protein
MYCGERAGYSRDRVGTFTNHRNKQTQQGNNMKKEWHCRYTSMHPGGSHHQTFPIFVKADTAAEAEAEVRMLRPNALKVWVIRPYFETWQISI